MKPGGQVGIWVVATVIGAGVVAAMFFLIRVPLVEKGTSPPAARGEAAMPVGIARFEGEAADQVLKDEALLRDPSPLFLPSRWSASGDVLREDAWREPGTAFRGYEAKLKFAEAELALQMPAVAAVPARVAEVFAVGGEKRPFRGFGQTGATPEPLPERAAFLRVMSAGDGEQVMAQPLAEARPPIEMWQPLEFLVAVDVTGVIRPPVLMESAGVAAVDSYFQAYIVDVLHLGERLAPGFYRVGIGP